MLNYFKKERASNLALAKSAYYLLTVYEGKKRWNGIKRIAFNAYISLNLA